MNQLIWIAGSILSLPGFIFLGSFILRVLKKPEPVPLSPGKLLFFPGNPKINLRRRRIESNPNIVCGFPIHQKSREEAPFS